MRQLLSIALLVCFAAHAQHSSELGRFSIDYPRGCAPVTVSVTATDTFGNTARTYFYEEGLTETTDTFYTYTEPGVYKIVQFPAIDVSPKTDTLVFEVLPPSPPQFNIFQCSATEIQVEVTDDTYDYYVVKFTSTDSVIHTPPDPPPSYDYGQASGNVQVIGYYDNSYPTCGDTFQAFNINDFAEASVSSATISLGCQNNFYLTVNAETDAFTKYQLEMRQGNESFQQVFEGAIHQMQTSYPITFNTAEVFWCIRINSVNPCTGEMITGESLCDTLDERSLSPLADAYATYQRDAILIHISPTLGNEISLYRRSGRSVNFSLRDVITQPFLDDIPSQSRAFEYKLVQQDTCGNKVDSVFLLAPFITLTDKNKHENTVTISSRDPQNELSTYEKFLMIYSQDSAVVVENSYNELINLPHEVGSTQHIRTFYQYPDSDIRLFSNELTTTYETTIFIPRAFTPNGDLLNDWLQLFGLPTNEFEISIFNRWGELVHRVANSNPVWNGMINEEPAPEGTYRYRLNFKMPGGEVKSQVGTFVLLKK